MQRKITRLIVLITTLLFQLETFNLSAQWVQRGADIDGEAAGDESSREEFGMSDDGNTVAIGAYFNDGNGTSSGHVRIYNWNGSAWVQRGGDIDGEAANDNSGKHVALSSDGNTVIIGADQNDGGGSDAGHARVYSWNGSAWVQKGGDIDGEAAGDESGKSVDISSNGNLVAIGASRNDGNGSNSGHVRVYNWNGSAWVQRGGDMDGEAAFDQLGFSVSLSGDGNTVASGGIRNDGNGTSAGHVRVYSWNGSAWVQKGGDIDGEAAGDEFGRSISLSDDGNVISAAAEFNDGNGTSSGSIRVYAWNGSEWIQRGGDIDGEAAGDEIGRGLCLSNNGTVVAGGALRNDGNGPNSGHARIYSWNGSTWNQLGADIDGEAANDFSGLSVRLSADGETIAIGANGNDGGGSIAGHVRVYDWTGPPLGVELLEFKAEWNNKEQTEVLASWTTETEINNEYFYLERSTDAIHFEDVARIDGAGNSTEKINYSYIDDGLFEEEFFFYRLRQTDIDGTITYSNIEVLNKEEGIDIIVLYPNPNFGSFKYLVLSSVDSQVNIEILDHLGRVVKKEKMEIEQGINNLSMNVSDLGSANYIIHVQTVDGLYKTSSRFILKKKQ